MKHLMSDSLVNQLFFTQFLPDVSLNFVWKHQGLSAGTGKLCIFGHLGLVFFWSCFVSRLLSLLYYVICAPVLTEGTKHQDSWENKTSCYPRDLTLSVLSYSFVHVSRT